MQEDDHADHVGDIGLSYFNVPAPRGNPSSKFTLSSISIRIFRSVSNHYANN